MKKKIALLLVGVMVVSITACNGKKDEVNTTETESSAEATSSYKQYGEVELCDYLNVAVEKTVTPVTEDDIDDKVDEILEENTQYNPLDTPVAKGNYVEMNFTASADGELIYDYADEAAGIIVGDGDLGEEVEKAFIGKNVGDTIQTTFSYDEDFENEDIAGYTLDYDITIVGIYEVIPAELGQDLFDYLGYADEADMREKIKVELEAENDAESMEALNQEIIAAIVENSNFTSYNQDLFDKCKAELEDEYMQWAAMFGLTEFSEVLDNFGMTEEEFDEEVRNRVYEKVAMAKVIEELGVTISDEEFEAAVQQDLIDYDYESEEEYFADYAKEDVRFEKLVAKACDIIKQSCQITEVEANPDEEINIDGEISDEDIMLDDSELGEGDEEIEVEE